MNPVHPQYQSLADPVAPAEAWTTVLPAIPGLILLLWGLWGIRRHLRVTLGLAAVLFAALLVRFVWFPVELHEFEGHEATYLDIFLGKQSLGQGGYMLYPALQWLYAGLGNISQNTGMLWAVSGLGSLLSIAATYGIGRRLFGVKRGLVAAALVAIWGSHAFWASSAYNVALPLGLALTALWALVLCAQEAEKIPAAALAAGAAVLAVSTRAECVLLAPIGLLLYASLRPRLNRKVIGVLLVGAALAFWALSLLSSGGPLPGSGERGEALALNLSYVGFWAPFDGWGLLLLLPAAAVGFQRNRRSTLLLVIALVYVHVAISSFNDVGFRHTLLGTWLVALLLSALIEVRWAWPVMVAAVCFLFGHTLDVADRYYMTGDRFSKNLAGAPEFPRSKLSECVLIWDDNPDAKEGAGKSHFNLLYPGPGEDLWALKGCVYWVFTHKDAGWRSLAVRDRAMRIEDQFRLESVGAATLGPGNVVSVLKVERPR